MNCWIELNGEALLSNFRAFEDILGGKGLVPVLKSNAYGHGLREIYSLLSKANPSWIGVIYTDEAKVLRDLGFQKRILMLGPIFEKDLNTAQELDLDILIDGPSLFSSWKKLAKRPRAHLKVDTGLSRRGFDLQTFEASIGDFQKCKEDIVGIATHLANVEDTENLDYTDFQFQNFDSAIRILKNNGWDALLSHAASSAAGLLIQPPHFSLTRVGISLYGHWPSEIVQQSYLRSGFQETAKTLKPVLSWKTKIASTREIPAGTFVGYGCTFKAPQAMKIAVLPVGYYEGYSRICSDHGAYVLIGGKRCPIVGRICMNMLMVSLEACPGAEEGDLVTLIGSDGNETISAEHLAEWSQTIQYEFLSRLHPQIPKKVL